tara:strand:- start:726 stop:1040 length:315 start_codon:yes stop_codon:yes gene_type:complete
MIVRILSSMVYIYSLLNSRQVFDTGDLKDDLAASRKIMDNLLAVMSEEYRDRKPNNVLIEIHDTVWERISKVSIHSKAVEFSRLTFKRYLPKVIQTQICGKKMY